MEEIIIIDILYKIRLDYENKHNISYGSLMKNKIYKTASSDSSLIATAVNPHVTKAKFCVLLYWLHY